MAHLHYIGVLAFIAICALFVSIAFKIRIRHFWQIFLLTDGAILAVYLIWDFWAISKRNWYFDSHQMLNIFIIPKVPLEEVLFFIVVPVTTVMTFKALLKITKWESDRK